MGHSVKEELDAELEKDMLKRKTKPAKAGFR